MKKLHIIALSIAGLLSTNVIAEEFSICRSDLTKQMKRFESFTFSVPQKLPTGDLKTYATQMEILCPWQIERDLNGDKQLDWIGIIYRNNKYELVAYMSSSKKYKLQVLRSYPFFPEQSYLSIIRNKNYIRKKFGSSRYNFSEITLNGQSRVYSWYGQKFKVIRSYLDTAKIEIDKELKPLQILKNRPKKIPRKQPLYLY